VSINLVHKCNHKWIVAPLIWVYCCC